MDVLYGWPQGARRHREGAPPRKRIRARERPHRAEGLSKIGTVAIYRVTHQDGKNLPLTKLQQFWQLVPLK